MNIKKILTDKRFYVIIAVLVLVLLLMNFNQRMVLLSKLRGQEKVLVEEYANLQATQSALETQIAYANSDAAVEEWAREEGHMVQSGDVPIVLLPGSSVSLQPTSVPTPEVVDRVEQWEIWWELFFGD
ncbi:MAG: septum formation initiator family protein [Anaerolineaceae bacterium]|nr:septum formation initiator family protein [Anaerolineaceae bacterium]